MRHGCTYVGTYCTYIISRIQENLLNKSVLHNREVLKKVANGRCFAVMCTTYVCRYGTGYSRQDMKEDGMYVNVTSKIRSPLSTSKTRVLQQLMWWYICMYISIQCTTYKTRYQPINNNKDGKKKV